MRKRPARLKLRLSHSATGIMSAFTFFDCFVCVVSLFGIECFTVSFSLPLDQKDTRSFKGFKNLNSHARARARAPAVATLPDMFPAG